MHGTVNIKYFRSYFSRTKQCGRKGKWVVEIGARKPSIAVAGDTCLKRQRPTQGCRAGDDVEAIWLSRERQENMKLKIKSNIFNCNLRNIVKFNKCLTKGIGTITGLRCPEGSRKLRFPDYVTTVQDGGRLSALGTGRFLPSGYTLGTHFCCGPGSSVGIATEYGLDGPGSNAGGDEIFHLSRPALGPT